MNEQLQRILDERAAALRQTPGDQDSDETVDILVLRAGPERLGLPLAEAEAVIADVTLATLPNLKTPWRGVVHLRGRFVAVADLGLLCGGGPTDIHHVVVLAADLNCALGMAAAPLASEVRLDTLASTSREGSPIARSLLGTAPDGTALFDSAALVASLRPETAPPTGRAR